MSLARFVHLRCGTRVCNEGVPRGVCNDGCVTSQLVLLQRSVTRSVTNVRRGSVTDPSKKITATLVCISASAGLPQASCFWKLRKVASARNSCARFASKRATTAQPKSNYYVQINKVSSASFLGEKNKKGEQKHPQNLPRYLLC